MSLQENWALSSGYPWVVYPLLVQSAVAQDRVVGTEHDHWCSWSRSLVTGLSITLYKWSMGVVNSKAFPISRSSSGCFHSHPQHHSPVQCSSSWSGFVSYPLPYLECLLFSLRECKSWGEGESYMSLLFWSQKTGNVMFYGDIHSTHLLCPQWKIKHAVTSPLRTFWGIRRPLGSNLRHLTYTVGPPTVRAHAMGQHWLQGHSTSPAFLFSHLVKTQDLYLMSAISVFTSLQIALIVLFKIFWV